ncbi:MAG: eukaryotic-like serine/threonine-protein kinase, partial [Chloroflexota bacterium]|nr:eukaryotic-like serine/threonine-protein kinase [Chloroflexota bacterium]
PVFRFEGPSPRVWIDDSAIAPARDTEAILIAADEPDNLDWRGRGNLYGRIGTYLQHSGTRPGREVVRDFARWAETASLIRETGSTSTQERIWSEAEPEQTLAQEGPNPARAFRLAAIQADAADVGARPRQGPLGTLAPTAIKVATNLADGRRERDRDRDRDRETRLPTTSAAATSPAKAPDEPAPMPVADPDEPAPMPVADPDADGSPMPKVRMPEMPEMPVMPPSGREGPPARAGTGAEPSSRPGEDETTPSPGPDAVPDEAPAVVPDPRVLRTAEQFIAALNQPGDEGKPLRIAADADWVLTGLQPRSNGRRKLLAEPGPTRPRFRFRPTPADFKAPTTWTLGIDLRSGSLQLEGIDLILTRDDAPAQGRWGAFGVGAGTELSLTRCTLTIEGDAVLSAAVVAQSFEGENGSGKEGAGADPPPAPAPARVQLTDSLLRSGGDLVEVTAGGQLALEMNNVVVATGGSLVHANGLPRGQAVAPVKLNLRQVSARMVGGLIQLESAPGEPELPLAEINARDSILATAAQGAPLLQVDGQDELSTLQNRIRWDGLRVAYHQINAYRRDQTAQVGTVPKIYNRPDWMVAVGPQEEAPIHGDLKFLQKWSPDRPAWTFRRDDFRLSPDSPASSAGADLAQIPAAW